MLFLSLLLSYLVGSIPFGYIAGLVYGVDIRTKGSGNIGATNVLRVLGKKPGIFVFILDAMKGIAAVSVIPQCVAYAFSSPTPPHILLILGCAVFVFLGHLFPAWLGFKAAKVSPPDSASRSASPPSPPQSPSPCGLSFLSPAATFHSPL